MKFYEDNLNKFVFKDNLEILMNKSLHILAEEDNMDTLIKHL